MRTAIVTGASSGLGKAIATRLLKNQWQVIGTYRQAPASDLPLQWQYLDLDRPESVAAFIEKIAAVSHPQSDDRLQLLINNAAYDIPIAAEDLTWPVLTKQFSGQVFGTICVTNGLLPLLHQTEGSKVFFVNSVFGFMSLPYRGCYVAAKHALTGYADALALELMDSRLQVCSLFPGPLSGTFRQRSARVLADVNPDLSQSRHRQNYQNVQTRLQQNRHSRESFTTDPAVLADRILRLVERAKVPSRVYPDLASKLIRLTMAALPRSLYDRLAYRYSGQGRV